MLSQNLICLDFGSQNLHMVYGRYNKGIFEVKNAVYSPIPEGVYKDGKIEDFQVLKGSVRRLISENKIKGKDVVLTIQSTSFITRDILLPVTNHQQLSNMVKYEIEQYLPIVATEYVIEYTVVGETMNDGISKYKIQVAAMPKQMVDNFLGLIHEIGLKPYALDVHSNAVSKLFTQKISINGDALDPEKTLAFIDLGYRSINIHIISKGKLAFSRIINLGARDIDNELSVACNMSLEQAEKKKIQEADLDPEEFNELMSDSFNDIIRSQVDIWLSEIQKIFQYFISRTTGNRIEGIYLYGGSSRLNGLNKYFERALNLRTRNIDDLDIIKLTKNITTFNPRYYINALGGLIRYE